MKKNRSDIFVTLAVIACSAVLLGALFFAVGGNPFAAPQLRFTVHLRDSGGLIEGSDVTYAGHVIGEVSEIAILSPSERLPGKSDHAIRIGVNVRKEIALPRNVIVRVKSASLLGSNHLALALDGEVEMGKLENGASLVGSSGGSLDSMVPGASELIAGIRELVDNLNTVVEGLGGAEAGQNAALALANFRDMSAELKDALGGEKGVRAFAERMNKVADEVHDLIAGAEGMEDESLKARMGQLMANLNATAEGWAKTFGGEKGVNARLALIAGGIDALVNGDPAANAKGLRESLPALASDLRGVAEETRVFLVYAEFFAGSLAAKPRRLLFGDNDDIRLPTKAEILEYYRREGETVPVDPSRFEDAAPKAERATPRRPGSKR